MLKWLPSGRRAWCLAAALLVLAGLAWHFAAASRLDPEALKTQARPPGAWTAPAASCAWCPRPRGASS